MRTNDANNYIVGQISRTVFSEVRTAASTKASRGFLDRIFISFSDIHDATAKAAEGRRPAQGRDRQGEEGLQGPRGRAEGRQGRQRQARRRPDASSTRARATWRPAPSRSPTAPRRSPTRSTGSPPRSARSSRTTARTIGDTARLVADSSQAVTRQPRQPRRRRRPAPRPPPTRRPTTLTAVYQARCEDALLPDPTSCPAAEEGQGRRAADVAKVAEDVNTLVKDNNGDLKKLDGQLADLQKQADDARQARPRTSTRTSTSAVAQDQRAQLGRPQGRPGRGQAAHRAGQRQERLRRSRHRRRQAARRAPASLDGGMFKLADGSGELAGGLHDGVEQDPRLRQAGPRPPYRGDGRPGAARQPVAAQGAQLRHRLRPVLHPALPLGRRDGRVHADPAAQPAGAGRRRLRLADRAGRLAAGRRDRRCCRSAR